MNLRPAAVLATCAVSWTALAQSSPVLLKGKILENTLDGKGVVANVGAHPPGNPLDTNSDGTFVLSFRQSHPGDRVIITVSKSDPFTHEEYAVINDVQLTMFLPSNPKTGDAVAGVTFIVCRKRYREEYAQLFYNLKSRQAIDAEWRKRVAPMVADKERLESQLSASSARQEELATEIREKDDQIASMQKARQEEENAAVLMSQQLAADVPGGSHERYQEAKRLILDGDVQGALRVLDRNAILKTAKDANRKVTEDQAQLKGATDEFLLRAAILIGQLQFDQAEAEYKDAIKWAPLSFDAHYRYGQMEMMLHRQESAIRLFERSRRIAEVASSNRDRGLALTALGNTYLDNKNFVQASSVHEEAVTAYEKLVKEDLVTYNPQLAGALINRGIAELRLNHLEVASQLFLRASKIVKDSLDPDAPRTIDLQARVNVELGIMNRKKDLPQETYDAYTSAISAFQKLVRLNPAEYNPSLAQAQNNFGVFEDEASIRVADPQTRKLLFDDAPKSLESAQKIRADLAARAPEVYEPDYAQTLTNLGRLYGARGQYDKAREYLEKAVNIRHAWIEKSPDAYRAEYINSLALLGKAYLAQYQSAPDAPLLVAAGSTYRTAVEVADKGAEMDPAGFAVQLGNVRTALADMYVLQGRLDDARPLYDAALAAYDKADEAAVAYPRFHTWSRIGYFRLEARDTPGAVEAFEQAQSYVGRLSAQDKQVYRHEVLDTASTLVALKVAQK
jgi:tetratricopeptide (TPR) repeat protein